MDLSNVYTILGIIVSTIILISLLSRLWNKYGSSETVDSVPSTITGGYRKWKKGMRKLRK
jgi:hypothetical protein